MDNNSLANWAQKSHPSIMQNMLDVLATPNLLSFTLGLPDSSLFPVDEIQEAAQKTVKCLSSLQYTKTADNPLKSQIVKLMGNRGVKCKEEEILITTGAQQALSIAARIFLNKNDYVLTDNFCYPGFSQILEGLEANILPFPCKEDGNTNYTLPHNLSNKPKCAFIMSDGHNPMGCNMSQETRDNVVNMSIEHDLPIIEDDAYGMVAYEKLLPPIKALISDNTIYIGSFSKIIAPSLRVGWIVAPTWFVDKCSNLKESSDINTITFSQHILTNLLNDNFITSHLKKITAKYEQRRDIMLGAIKQYFPQEAYCNTPKNGFFIWVTLPKEINTTKLLLTSIDNIKVAFMPGEAFCVQKTPVTNTMRLSFSNVPIEQIEEGISRLGKLIKTLVVKNAMMKEVII